MTADPGVVVDTHDMLLIHRVIRREIGALPRLFRAATNDSARARLIGAHAVEMLDFLHAHHHGEDELLYPLLRDRVTLDADLLDRMDAQHAAVDESVRALRADLTAWTRSPTSEVSERMAAAVEAMMPTLIDHLAEEEQQLLPVVARTVSQSEWDQLGKHGMAAIPPKRRLVVLGHIIEETDEAERTRFLVSVPPPARLAYRLIGKRQFARETAAIRG